MQNGRYEILETIGCGATSRVDKARDTVIGRVVALKTFLRGVGAGTSYQHFLREAQIVGQLSHPAIVGLYDVGLEEHGATYLVMEYVAGNTLEKLLAQGPIPFHQACAWSADLASALARAHAAGIIHGDVKPANILVTQEGRVKLGDFGIARFATQLSSSGSLMGTPAYLSPEQIQGLTQGSQSDLFSLGIVLYEMVTGERPFAGTSIGAVCAQILHADAEAPSRLNPAVSPALDHIVGRCLAKNPAKRYASGDDLARDLYPLARRTTQPSPRAWRPRTIPSLLRPAVWAAGALAIIVALVPVALAVRARLRVPPIPTAIAPAPKAPEDILGYTKQQPIPQPGGTPSPTILTGARSAKDGGKASRRGSSSTKPRSASRKTILSAVDLPQLNWPLQTPGLGSPEDFFIETRRGQLEIEILAQAADETLAIFADRELLFTTFLRAEHQNKPLRLRRALPLGPHQLRVVLYRPDKSLQTQKEGLAEIRGDADNKLAIRVARRSRFLLKRGTALEVIWPAASTAAAAADTVSSRTAVSRVASTVSQFPR